MGQFDRVLWEEGMFLGPQHFQQWDRHHARMLDRRVRSLQPHFWGLGSLAVDEDALAGGELRLTRVGGVFRDGTLFDAPAVDALPPARNAAEAIDPGMPKMGVFVAVPAARAGAMVDTDAKTRGTRRFAREVITVVDEAKGALERNVAACLLNLRLLFEGEPPEGFEVLQIGVLKRGAAGALVLDPTFVPTCLSVSAAPAIGGLLRRVSELMSSKSDELMQKRGQRMGGTAQWSGVEAAGFWLLHTVNSFLPLVAHHYAHQAHHPEAVYRDLASFCGALCTFLQGEHPNSVPAYEHADLTTTFTELESHIQKLSVEIVPETCVPIPLHRLAEGTFTGRVGEALFTGSSFFLAVNSSVPTDKVVREIPFKAKVSSPQQLEFIRAQAVRGVVLVHAPSPPRDIPQRSGFHYFELTQDGRHWDAIRESRTLALYVPEEFADLAIECMAVKRTS